MSVRAHLVRTRWLLLIVHNKERKRDLESYNKQHTQWEALKFASSLQYNRIILSTIQSSTS